MKNPTIHSSFTSSPLKLGTVLLAGVLAAIALPFFFSARSQSRPRTISSQANSAPGRSDEVLKVDVDLITVDALVLEKKSARVVGDLRQADFTLSEDGVMQAITHFSQDSLPISMLLLVDRGACLDPFGTEVREATRQAIARLKPSDEVALMSYHDEVELLQEFTRDRDLVSMSLDRVPPHHAHGRHCLNKAFGAAADYVQKAGNPIGRRVIVVITGVTRDFDCLSGMSGKAAAQAIYESGAVVSAIVPETAGQRVENGMMVWATRIGKLGRAPYMDIKTLANETGGEILSDKPERLNTTFADLISHLRTRYNLAFTSTNKNRDGTTRKLKIDVGAPAQTKSKLVIKARRSYVAPQS